MRKAAVATALGIAAAWLASPAAAAAQVDKPATEVPLQPAEPAPPPPAPALASAIADATASELTQAEFEAAVRKPGFNDHCLRLTDAARGIANALAAMNGQTSTICGGIHA